MQVLDLCFDDTVSLQNAGHFPPSLKVRQQSVKVSYRFEMTHDLSKLDLSFHGELPVVKVCAQDLWLARIIELALYDQIHFAQGDVSSPLAEARTRRKRNPPASRNIEDASETFCHVSPLYEVAAPDVHFSQKHLALHGNAAGYDEKPPGQISSLVIASPHPNRSRAQTVSATCGPVPCTKMLIQPDRRQVELMKAQGVLSHLDRCNAFGPGRERTKKQS